MTFSSVGSSGLVLPYLVGLLGMLAVAWLLGTTVGHLRLDALDVP